MQAPFLSLSEPPGLLPPHSDYLRLPETPPPDSEALHNPPAHALTPRQLDFVDVDLGMAVAASGLRLTPPPKGWGGGEVQAFRLQASFAPLFGAPLFRPFRRRRPLRLPALS